MSDHGDGDGLPGDLVRRWSLDEAVRLPDGQFRTWRVRRGGEWFAAKLVEPALAGDLEFEHRVLAGVRARGWPAPELAEEPVPRADGVWRLFGWLPGEPVGAEEAGEAFARGRRLAAFHAAAAGVEVPVQRGGFGYAEDVVGDPGLEHWLRVHERHRPAEGRILRAHCEAAVEAFDEYGADSRRGLIHGDFARWNLLFADGELTGLLDFEASHRNHLVSDFALSWRGWNDDVIRGYDSVRPLAEGEWHLVRPALWAWGFIDLKNRLAAHYEDGAPLDLSWPIRHCRKQSALLDAVCGPKNVRG